MHAKHFSRTTPIHHACAVVLLLLWPLPAKASQVEFGPVIGGGNTDDPATVVRHVSGFRLQAAPYQWSWSGRRVQIAPLIGAQYLLVNTRTYTGEPQTITAAYAQSLILGGMQAIYPLPGDTSGRVYLAATTGFGQGKLNLYQANNAHFTEATFDRLPSRLYSAELGITGKLRERVSVFASAAAVTLTTDQRQISGMQKNATNTPENSRLNLSTAATTTAASGLPDYSRQQLWTISAGTIMEFF